MPMKYQALIGEIRSSLSGGQRRRVFIARAFYKSPRVLLLDEATSHLDLPREARVNQEIAKQSLTRIVIAHRPETISYADRVLALHDGNLVEIFSRSSDRARASVATI